MLYSNHLLFLRNNSERFTCGIEKNKQMHIRELKQIHRYREQTGGCYGGDGGGAI